MRRLLDDAGRIARVDRSDMLGSIYRSPDPLLSSPDFASSQVKKSKSVDELVFVGMGGSASAGDVLVDWLSDEFEIPARVSRDPQLPRTTSEKTLVVCISYSGETWETLQAFREALKIGCRVVGVGSGGSLKRLCEKTGLPFYQVSPGGAPRAALARIIVAGCAALTSLGVVGPVEQILRQAGRELTTVRESLGPNIPSSENRAKKLALFMTGRTPLIYAFSRMGSVARRFKNQLAENSKIVGKYELLPEACHNEIESLASLRGAMVPLMIRDWRESSMEKAVFRAFKSTIHTTGGSGVLEVREKAESKLGRLLAPILLLDYVSAYMAVLRGVDPSPTNRIIDYKRKYAATKTRPR